MIRQTIEIPDYGWTVYAFFAVDKYYVDEIVCRLQELGCEDSYIRKATALMVSKTLNNGLTYSDLENRKTVFVVGVTTAKAQFLNSLVHEIRHLTNHICEAQNIGMKTEESCYLSGAIAELMYERIKGVMC